ncbi:10597_t:CDS:1, partial [Acaulospora morrowiae]
MSILKGALERLLAEAQSSKQKELEQVCSTALEQLQQEINYLLKRAAIKRGKQKANPEDSVNETPKIETSGTDTKDAKTGETSEIVTEKAEKNGKAGKSTPKTSAKTSPKKNFETSVNGRASTSSSLFARAGEELPKVLADNYWQPFRLACGNTMPVNIRVIALDCLQKVIAHGLLIGDNPISPPKIDQAKKRESKAKHINNGFSETNDFSLLDTSTSFDTTESSDATSPINNSPKFPNPFLLIDDVVHSICTGFVGPQTDQTVQLQILKVLLTLITTEQCPVHGISLLKIIQTCCNIYCFSKSQVNQATAKAELTQISNFIVARFEETSAKLSKSDSSKQQEITYKKSAPENNSTNEKSVQMEPQENGSSTRED